MKAKTSLFLLPLAVLAFSCGQQPPAESSSSETIVTPELTWRRVDLKGDFSFDLKAAYQDKEATMTVALKGSEAEIRVSKPPVYVADFVSSEYLSTVFARGIVSFSSFEYTLDWGEDKKTETFDRGSIPFAFLEGDGYFDLTAVTRSGGLFTKNKIRIPDIFSFLYNVEVPAEYQEMKITSLTESFFEGAAESKFADALTMRPYDDEHFLLDFDLSPEMATDLYCYLSEAAYTEEEKAKIAETFAKVLPDKDKRKLQLIFSMADMSISRFIVGLGFDFAPLGAQSGDPLVDIKTAKGGFDGQLSFKAVAEEAIPEYRGYETVKITDWIKDLPIA